MTPTLSIIVVVYNSSNELAGCLASVADDVRSGWAELIIVDNASPDQSVAVARRELPEVRAIALDHNIGFAGGVNAALPSCVGAYVLLLNPDVVVPPGGLRDMVDWMERHPIVGAASPDIGDPDGVRHVPARAFPSILRTLLELTRMHKLLSVEARSQSLLGTYWSGHDETDVGWVPGTAMFVRARVIRKIGGLSPKFFMYGEDIEWCWRMRRAGFHVGVRADTRFTHAASTSATRSWGEEQTADRVACGIHSACVLMYGAHHARALAVLTALALGVEACASGRSAAQRAAARLDAHRWLRLARRA